MKKTACPRGAAALVGFALFAATALAHPGHDENSAVEQRVEIFLAQLGLTPAGEPVAPRPRNAVTITIEGDSRIIKSNGWPESTPAFPRRGNPNTATPQSYTFRVPLKPQAAAVPERRGGWWWGVALDGVPFEPGTAETWNNDPQSGWRYEAATGFLDLGLDENNAHVQPTGAYHYHAVPTGLVAKLGGTGRKMLLIGWAADGFPIYTGWAYSEAKNAGSALRKMKSGYRLRPGARPVEPGGPVGNYDGRFTQDFEYADGAGDLDETNGRTGVTPEFPEGTYYYCISAEFPFVPRAWHGTPDPSFAKGGGRPGGPGGRPPLPVVTALDVNHDGIIDAEELAKAPALLKTLDRNGDGRLTPDEYLPPPPAGGRPGPPP